MLEQGCGFWFRGSAWQLPADHDWAGKGRTLSKEVIPTVTLAPTPEAYDSSSWILAMTLVAYRGAEQR